MIDLSYIGNIELGANSLLLFKNGTAKPFSQSINLTKEGDRDE